MDSSQYKKNPDIVSKSVKFSGDRTIAVKPVYLLFPERYVQVDLAIMSDSTYIVGFFAIVDEQNNYGVSMIPAMIRTSPDRVNKVVIDDTTYMRLEYDPGSAVIEQMNVVKSDNLVHSIYQELMELAKIPFYYSYTDVPKFFLETTKYNGFKLGYDPVALEYLAGFMFRDPEQIGQSFRHRANAKKDINVIEPVVIGLSDVTIGSNNFITKVTKSYSTDGITSALNNPARRAERIETMLRSTTRTQS